MAVQRGNDERGKHRETRHSVGGSTKIAAVIHSGQVPEARLLADDPETEQTLPRAQQIEDEG